MMDRTDAAAPPARESFDRMEKAELLDRYTRGVERFERRLLDLDDSQLDTYFRPEAGVGRWSCRVLVGHVADAELVQAHRMRRAAAEDRPVFALWDENAFIDAGLYAGEAGGVDRPVAGSVAIIHTVRLWMADWLRSLAPETFARQALHPEAGPVTVMRLLTGTTWHLEHHAWFLSRKLERLLGPAPNGDRP